MKSCFYLKIPAWDQFIQVLHMLVLIHYWFVWAGSSGIGSYGLDLWAGSSGVGHSSVKGHTSVYIGSDSQRVGHIV